MIRSMSFYKGILLFIVTIQLCSFIDLVGSEAGGRDGSSLIHEELERGNKQRVYELIDDGADVNARKTGKPLITRAVFQGYEDVLCKLIDNNADVNATDVVGETPIFDAVREKRKGMFHTLIAYGADINTQPFNGQKTPLHSAADLPCEQIIDDVIEAGADVNFQAHEECSPLHVVAVKCESKYVARRLIEAGAKIHVKAEEGYTPYDAAKYSELGSAEMKETFQNMLSQACNGCAPDGSPDAYISIGQGVWLYAREAIEQSPQPPTLAMHHAIRTYAHYVPRDDNDKQYLRELHNFIEQYKGHVQPQDVVDRAFSFSLPSPKMLRSLYQYYPHIYKQYVDNDGAHFIEKVAPYPCYKDLAQDCLYMFLHTHQANSEAHKRALDSARMNNTRFIRNWNHALSRIAVLTNNGLLLLYYQPLTCCYPASSFKRDINSNKSRVDSLPRDIALELVCRYNNQDVFSSAIT